MTTDPEKWVDSYGDVLYRYALLRVGEPTVAEDLVQETLCSAFEGRERFSGKSSEGTWLVGILKHKVADYFRKEAWEVTSTNGEVLPQREEDDLFDENGRWRIMPNKWKETPEDALENKEFWEIFHGCLDGLSPNLRQAFAFRELDGMDSAEICKVLGLSSTNLWVILHRARNGLRRCLELNWFEERR